ncbi:GlxA family transcriptional regulator [Leclercia adecarboxylata]|uniref:GlxA family transcriptional regulator n=1 Tax=Leclercia adecarboxylata TaxID=83655 RepID=UPI0013E00624|nr:helix-turn-helix domain-containing protein [Leclercia adecarboxylata]MCU6675682.1 helix-turn-helix domain-containing protein [Leclercia adecarboxylata]MCV3303469.1 helix-turn-helix domain-containing protein [Leclercia adecarboxylata]MCV3307271.1 helix-turn-helix domain-containing protein [Leclercia adecarboxylata]MDU1651682.1 helix-turn-helix domain-containing protein [Leclercia adecarboxylata]QIG28752.1 helix-turn-helix domain-containing protein [Leclercia adecarboxylata]
MSALHIVVIATPGFSPFHFSVPSMVFDKAMPERGLFEVTVCAEQPGTVVSDIGISINVEHGPEQLETADIIIVPFWEHPETRPAPALLDALGRAWQRGAEVAGLCLGAYVLAYAGLLDNRRASTHWEFEQDFARRFPQVRLDSNALYTSDERLITSAGTAAGIDCCLNIVREHYGTALANRVARRMVIPPYREGGQAQFIEHAVPETTRDEQINDLIDYLRRNLDKRHDIDSLAGYAGMSRRTLTRHFIKATGMTVGDWLSAQRLQRSQELLETTDHSIEVVSSLAGYQSPVSFRQSFKARYNVSPSEWRRTFRGPGLM